MAAEVETAVNTVLTKVEKLRSTKKEKNEVGATYQQRESILKYFMTTISKIC